jgi:hypothetical protein
MSWRFVFFPLLQVHTWKALKLTIYSITIALWLKITMHKLYWVNKRQTYKHKLHSGQSRTAFKHVCFRPHTGEIIFVGKFLQEIKFGDFLRLNLSIGLCAEFFVYPLMSIALVTFIGKLLLIS